MDIARPSGRLMPAAIRPAPMPWSREGARASALPPQPLHDDRAAPARPSSRVLTMSVEDQARTLLSAVAQPGDATAQTGAVLDYTIHLLVDTHILSEVMLELVEEGTLDAALRPLLGALLGLPDAPALSQRQSLELHHVESALADVQDWHTKLRATGEQVLPTERSGQACCPVSCTLWADLDFPVAVDVGPVACVFEARSILQWMQVSMQSPGRRGVAVNPLDRRPLRLGQLKAVRWA